MGAFVVERLRVADDAIHVDDKRLVLGQDLVFADVAELGGAVAVRRLHADDLPVNAVLVHLPDVTGLRERRGVFVNIRYGYVHGGAEKEVGAFRKSDYWL